MWTWDWFGVVTWRRCSLNPATAGVRKKRCGAGVLTYYSRAPTLFSILSFAAEISDKFHLHQINPAAPPLLNDGLTPYNPRSPNTPSAKQIRCSIEFESLNKLTDLNKLEKLLILRSSAHRSYEFRNST